MIFLQFVLRQYRIDYINYYSQFQKDIYKVSVTKIHILRFPLLLAGRWNMGDMQVETL